MKMDKMTPTNTDAKILSDGEFAAEVFARAKRKKAAFRKKVAGAIATVCAACFVFTGIGIGISSAAGGNKADAAPGRYDDNFISGYNDYAIVDGNYVFLQPEESNRLRAIIDAASKNGEYIIENGVTEDYCFAVMIDGVRYMFFKDGVSFKNTVVKSKNVGNIAKSVLKGGL